MIKFNKSTNRLNPQKNQGISLRLSLKLNRLIVACLCFLAFSCDNQVVYDQFQPIQNASWAKEKEYYFTFQIEDITVPYDLTLEVRNSNLYPYQNLWIFSKEEHPFGPLKRDTMECMLADEFGKWYGQGISLFQSSFPIRIHYKFPIAGQYTFSFRQGMRNEELQGIQEIGLRIVESSNAPSEKHLNEGK